MYHSFTNFSMPMLHLNAYNLENKHQVIISTYHSCKFIMCIKYLLTQELNFSMTSVLTHPVAHSTRSKFNNQPIKKSCGQLSKSCQKWQNSDFQSQFSMSKMITIFLKKIFIEEYHFRSTFLSLTFFENFNF